VPKSVVTGGAGFIGSNLVDLLVDEGHDVLVLDDLSSGSISNLKGARSRGNVTLHQIDITHNEVVDLVRGFQPETVFHLAAQIDVRHSVADPVMDATVNVVGTVNVLEAARHGNAERFVFSSSGGATYGDTFNIPTPETEERNPASPYGVSKAVVDQYFAYYDQAHDLDCMSLGFSNVYGPRHMISTACRSASRTYMGRDRIRMVKPESWRSSSEHSSQARLRRSSATAFRLATSCSSKMLPTPCFGRRGSVVPATSTSAQAPRLQS
jgi:nucleoside-diphosphate-sugar epimerase